MKQHKSLNLGDLCKGMWGGKRFYETSHTNFMECHVLCVLYDITVHVRGMYISGKYFKTTKHAI